MTPDEIARKCADLMWADDKASRALDATIEHVAPGAADVSMTVRETMTNGHGMCHGGYIFTLADTAFAFACNTYNQRCVAQHCSISPPSRTAAAVAAAMPTPSSEETSAAPGFVSNVRFQRALDCTIWGQFCAMTALTPV